MPNLGNLGNLAGGGVLNLVNLGNLAGGGVLNLGILSIGGEVGDGGGSVPCGGGGVPCGGGSVPCGDGGGFTVWCGQLSSVQGQLLL